MHSCDLHLTCWQAAKVALRTTLGKVTSLRDGEGFMDGMGEGESNLRPNSILMCVSRRTAIATRQMFQLANDC